MENMKKNRRKPASREPKKLPIEKGSGNLFADIGLEMSDEDMLKVHLALAINRTIQKRDLTQVAAGEKMGIDQSKVSKILRGQLDGFSPQRLIHYYLSLGRDIEIRFPDRWRSERGELKVRCA
jgi:predicted XRE-type DNA-binding protein